MNGKRLHTKKGLKTFIDREGVEERDYNFSEEMLSEI